MKGQLMLKIQPKQHEFVAPSKTNLKEPKIRWFVDVSPFSKGVFSGSSR